MNDGSAGVRSDARLRRRYRAERVFRACGALAVVTAVAALGVLLITILSSGLGGFWRHEVRLDVSLDLDQLDLAGGFTEADLARASFASVVRSALYGEFPEVQSRRERRALRELLSLGAEYDVSSVVRRRPELLGGQRSFWVPLADEADLFFKGWIAKTTPEKQRALSDTQIGWLETLDARGRIDRRFNTSFLTTGDSREPELAGLGGAMIGSLLTLVVTLALCLPIGVAAAIYLEEFASKNQVTNWIEVNINNLAAVPSIIFGLFGLGIFLNTFGVPRSAPLAGGLVLSLMTLPTIIIASRAAISAVPPSIRAGALAVGASPMQVVVHHVIPLALPGILTGTIIGMARALGETAPLLMIGMVAFIVDVPQGLTSPATVLPVQVYLWADSPERAFVEKTAAAILVLIGFLILMNSSAVVLRRRFERRW